MPSNSHEDIKVSVLCVAYNHEKYIREALEGFVKQKTNFRYEVLIHDDASTDGTADIIREYAEKFPEIVKPIFQKENQYSKGIDIYAKHLYPRVKGKYVAYCEGDDYWTDEHKLQKQFEAMEQNPGCSICVHKARCINEDGTLRNKTIPLSKYGFHGGLQDKKTVAEHIWTGYPFHTSSYFIRFDCFSKSGNYDYAKYLVADQTLLRAALNFGDFWYIDEEMSFRRKWSIGGFNSTMLRASCESKRKHWSDFITGDILYDRASGQKFHEYITRSIPRKIMGVAQLEAEECHVPFRKKYCELLDEFGISRSSAFSSLSLKYKLKYFILVFAPKLILWTRPVRVKLKQRFN